MVTKDTNKLCHFIEVDDYLLCSGTVRTAWSCLQSPAALDRFSGCLRCLILGNQCKTGSLKHWSTCLAFPAYRHAPQGKAQVCADIEAQGIPWSWAYKTHTGLFRQKSGSSMGPHVEGAEDYPGSVPLYAPNSGIKADPSLRLKHRSVWFLARNWGMVRKLGKPWCPALPCQDPHQPML